MRSFRGDPRRGRLPGLFVTSRPMEISHLTETRVISCEKPLLKQQRWGSRLIPALNLSFSSLKCMREYRQQNLKIAGGILISPLPILQKMSDATLSLRSVIWDSRLKHPIMKSLTASTRLTLNMVMHSSPQIGLSPSNLQQNQLRCSTVCTRALWQNRSQASMAAACTPMDRWPETGRMHSTIPMEKIRSQLPTRI